MTSIQSKDVEDLCLFLELEIPTMDEEVLENIRKHKIDGATFLQLDEQYLKELAPLLGDRMKLKKIVVAGVEAISSQTVEEAGKHSSVATDAVNSPAESITGSVSNSGIVEVWI